MQRCVNKEFLSVEIPYLKIRTEYYQGLVIACACNQAFGMQ